MGDNRRETIAFIYYLLSQCLFSSFKILFLKKEKVVCTTFSFCDG